MTKLTKLEKTELKADILRYNPPLHFFQFPELGVTVAIELTGEGRGKVAWSICAQDEEKFRKSVGKKIALDRLRYDGMPIENKDVETDLEIIAKNIACAVTNAW